MFSNLEQKVQISKSEIGTRFEETEHLNVRLISVHTVHRKDTQNKLHKNLDLVQFSLAQQTKRYLEISGRAVRNMSDPSTS